MTSRIGSPDTDADRSLRVCLNESPTRSFIMVAGAGSGKTTSLVKALASLEVAKGPHLRRNGQRVACITFTEVAVGEIRGDVGDTPLLHVSTIHSFLWSLVHSFHADIRKWVAERIAEKIADARDKISRPRTQAKTKQQANEDIERYQAQLISLEGVKKFTYGTGSRYDQGILGHDDVLRIGPALIKKHPLMRSLIARRYPFIFVDESQDTNPEVISALKEITLLPGIQFCLGFFGDPMQKIYLAGAGAITAEADWTEITKPENFRCPAKVLNVINRIRAEDDGLVQTEGTRLGTEGPLPRPTGSAKLFLYPNTGIDRTACLDQVRAWMAQNSNDPLWLKDDESGDVRVLVLVHRMAAKRLGFEDIYAALNDNDAPGFKEGLQEGSVWAVKPFLNFVLPLVEAARRDDAFTVISLLRQQCPLLEKEQLAGRDMAALLAKLQEQVHELSDALRDDSLQTVKQVLTLLQTNRLVELDERFKPYLSTQGGDEEDLEYAALIALLTTPVIQMWGYSRYISDQSPFSTQQGVKGAQFQRVLVLLDDAESDYRLFSYAKYWGFEALSDTDKQNLAADQDSVISRTRRLFYVCCSRAVRDLAVVFFVPNLAAALAAVHAKAIFSAEDVLTLPII